MNKYSDVYWWLQQQVQSLHAVCRPHEHGEDMLAAMSAILNDYSEQHHSSAVCLVLHGLHALCEAEV